MIDLGNPLVVGGLLTVLASVTTSVVTIINAIKTKRVEQKVDEAAAERADASTKLDTIHEKTTETLANTNGNLHRLQEQLARADERETTFKQMLSELTTVLAAQRGAVVVAPTTPTRSGRSTDKPDDSNK